MIKEEGGGIAAVKGVEWSGSASSSLLACPVFSVGTSAMVDATYFLTRDPQNSPGH